MVFDFSKKKLQGQSSCDQLLDNPHGSPKESRAKISSLNSPHPGNEDGLMSDSIQITVGLSFLGSGVGIVEARYG